MIVLPTTPTPPSEKDPKNLIIFGPPKIGKTTALAQLPNALVLDFEEGSDYVTGLKVKIIGIKPPKENPQMIEVRHSEGKYYLVEILSAVKQAGFPYEYGIIDTTTALEEMALVIALEDYKNTSMGKNYEGTDVRTLPNGAGYYYVREAFIRILKSIERYFPKVILVGHLKDKLIETKGKEVSVSGLDLTGKLASIVSANSDAIGFLYRNKDGQNILSFKSKETVICGARPDHLKDRDIVLSALDEHGNLITHWEEVFTTLKS